MTRGRIAGYLNISFFNMIIALALEILIYSGRVEFLVHLKIPTVFTVNLGDE